MSKVFNKVVLLAYIVILSGCMATTPTKPDSDHSVDKISTAERQQIALTPFYINSDYFEKRMVESRVEAEQQAITDKEEEKHILAESIQKYASLKTVNLKPKTSAGLIYTANEENLLLSKLETQLRTQQADYNIRFINSNRVNEVIQNTSCAEYETNCLALELSKFPGVRFLTFITDFSMPKQLPGTAALSVKIVDSALPFHYPETKFVYPISHVSDVTDFNKMVSQQLLQTIESYSSIGPFLTRHHSQKQGKWYVYAGNNLGVEVGDEFSISSESELILSPQNLPIAYKSATSRGTLKIVEQIGDNLSLCSHIAGDQPLANDVLILQESR